MTSALHPRSAGLNLAKTRKSARGFLSTLSRFRRSRRRATANPAASNRHSPDQPALTARMNAAASGAPNSALPATSIVAPASVS